MAVDELWKLTTGFIKGWKKGKLKEKLNETAKIAYDEKIKNIDLEEKIGHLKDEIKRLKGEKIKPKINPANTNKDLNPSKKKPHKKKQKKNNLDIDEVIECDIDKNDLPRDAKFIGQRDIVIQEMIIQRRNIKFIIKRYFSKELGKVLEGEVPSEFKGSEFGPQLISFVIYEYYKNRVTQKKILEMLKDWGLEMSAGTLCSILNKPSSDFKEDLASAKKAAIKKSSQIFVDDTGARIMGMNGNTCGVSNQYFTQYTTGFEKNRWATVGAIFGGIQSFFIDNEALEFIARKAKRAKITSSLYSLRGGLFDRSGFEKKLKEVFNFKIRKDELDIVRTACAISALRNKDGPKIRFLVSDDGSNFVDIFKNHQLCWVHEIRKYKKMVPYHEVHRKSLSKVIKRWQELYSMMKRFKENLCSKLREKIREEFNKNCSLKTKFPEIDEQLCRTLKNKVKLLLFLRYPKLPLHSNMIETDLRERVIKRKISLQNRSLEGVKAWDLMLSLVSTCRKIGLSFWRYLEDRIAKREVIPYLGKLVNSL